MKKDDMEKDGDVKKDDERPVRYRMIEPHIRQEWKKYYVIVGTKKYSKHESLKSARQMKKQLIEEGIIKHNSRGRPPGSCSHKHEDRYITKLNNGKFRLQKKVDGKVTHFGLYPSLEEAREEREFWESIDWDFDLIDLH